MSKKPKRYNGLKRRQILRARLKILREIERTGSITNAKAKKIGKFSQVWFHLKNLEKAGVIRHANFNEWTLIPQKRWPKDSPFVLGPQR